MANQEIQETLIHYIGNGDKTVAILEKELQKDFDSIQEICAEFERDWNSVECDYEQDSKDAELDSILEYHAERLLNL